MPRALKKSKTVVKKQGKEETVFLVEVKKALKLLKKAESYRVKRDVVTKGKVKRRGIFRKIDRFGGYPGTRYKAKNWIIVKSSSARDKFMAKVTEAYTLILEAKESVSNIQRDSVEFEKYISDYRNALIDKEEEELLLGEEIKIFEITKQAKKNIKQVRDNLLYISRGTWEQISKKRFFRSYYHVLGGTSRLLGAIESLEELRDQTVKLYVLKRRIEEEMKNL